MKIKNLLSLLGMVAFLSMRAVASIDYSYLYPSYADGSGQITVTYPTNYTGGQQSEAGIYVGELVIQNPLTKQDFYTFCLSPEGRLYPGTAAYTPMTFEAAKYGNEPNAWATTGGIENASFLWTQDNAHITNNDQGAAFNLALWTALYNSTGLGQVSATGRFSVSGSGFSPEIAADYQEYLDQINSADAGAVENSYLRNQGYILRPVDPTMQDLIVLPSAIPEGTVILDNKTAMAPEPGSVFCIGLLGLVTLGGVAREKIKLPWRS